MYKPRDVNS